MAAECRPWFDDVSCLKDHSDLLSVSVGFCLFCLFCCVVVLSGVSKLCSFCSLSSTLYTLLYTLHSPLHSTLSSLSPLLSPLLSSLHSTLYTLSSLLLSSSPPLLLSSSPPLHSRSAITCRSLGSGLRSRDDPGTAVDEYDRLAQLDTYLSDLGTGESLGWFGWWWWWWWWC
jgi:hypothetical protein